MQDKWTFRVGKIRKTRGHEAKFKDMIEFIEEESLALNNPIYSRQGFKDKGGTNMTAFLTVQARVSCPLYKEPHDLDDCSRREDYAREERFSV